jgi:hypothetical protein
MAQGLSAVLFIVSVMLTISIYREFENPAWMETVSNFTETKRAFYTTNAVF